MASTRILATGTIVAGGDIAWHISPLPVEDEPPTRDDRTDEAAFLADTARYYEWLKTEREDYADYLADIEWLRLGC